ncbi:MAG: hypothetical protein GY787_05860 [Alteromonadales bacterium]|nr:hypothetical protein [Alteromonadales bacterium]
MRIIGAGMSGLLAAHYFRHLCPVVLEKQKSLPNNHQALLRFRTSAVSDLTGIPFKKVKVQKMAILDGAEYQKPNLLISNLYSRKVSGQTNARSIGNLDDCERYIAPGDFINKLSKGIDIKYNTFVDFVNNPSNLTISTMPVAALANALGYKDLPELKTKEIWTVKFDLWNNVDVYQTIYYPSHMLPLYRLSITGKTVIAEFCESPDELSDEKIITELSKFIESHFGIPCHEAIEIKRSYQKFGKLIECDTEEVKKFIGWATREHNVYSLGRWGCHRQLLMDDVVKDIKQVDKLIRSNGYNL